MAGTRGFGTSIEAITPSIFRVESSSELLFEELEPFTTLLVLADEPTGNLDAATGQPGIIDLMFDLNAKQRHNLDFSDPCVTIARAVVFYEFTLASLRHK